MRSLGNTPVDGEVRAVASGTLPSGQPVIVNANGTVSVVGGTPVSQAVGSNAVFEAASTTMSCAAYDANSNKVVVAFVDSADTVISPKGKAVVGTISGTSITFGATATWHPNSTSSVAIVYHAAAQKVVIVYYDGDNSGYGTSVVGSVSGTNISFGSTVIFNSSNTNGIGLVYDPIAEKVVVAYRDAGASNLGKAQVGTVSGTNISWGTAVVYNNGTTGSTVSCAYDINANKTVLAYKAENNSSYGTAIVGTVSGTSISFGSSVVFETATTDNLWVGYDSSSQKVVISYRDRGNSDFGTAIVGSVSGTSISFGTAAVFEAAATQQTVVIENTAAGFVNIFYRDGGDSNKGKFVTATVSGTSLTFSAVTSLTSGGSSNLRQAYDSTSEQMVFVYKDQANSSYGTAVVVRNAYTPTNLTAENYIGMSSGSVNVSDISQAVGTPVTFRSALCTYIAAAYDSANNKVVIAYQDRGNSSYGTAVVGTVDSSDNSISFGTPVVFESANTQRIATTYDVNAGKVLVSFNADGGNSGRLTSIVGTVSNTSISFGSAVVINTSNSATHVASAYDANAQKVVLVATTAGTPAAFVCTISGTSVSSGSRVVFGGNGGEANRITYDANAQKVVVICNYSSAGRARVGTVSGTSISFGTETTFNTSTMEEPGIAYDASAQKVVIAYKNSGNSDYGTAIVGTVSGTTISFGSSAVYNSSSVGQNNVVYDASAQSVVISYQLGGTNGSAIAGKINGTSITFNTATVFQAGTVENVASTYDSTSERVVIAYRDQPNATGDAAVFETGYTNITRDEVASGSSAVIDSGCAISTNQLSLTAGQQYFVQTDGTLGLTAADPSVLAGTAVSATKLIVKG